MFIGPFSLYGGTREGVSADVTSNVVSDARKP